MSHKTNRTNHTQPARKKRSAVAYTDGNTVRVENPYELPRKKRHLTEKEKEQIRRQEREAQKRKLRQRRNRDKSLQMNPGFVLFLSLATVCILLISIQYVKVQTSIVSAMEAIEKKELELEELKANNDLLERKIQTYVDLEYVYEAAKEMGMVHPTDYQILFYEKTESEYVRQYDKIP